MRIGCDVDGCIYPWTLAVNEAVEQRFRIHGLSEHTSWNYLKPFLTWDQWNWVWSAEAAPQVFGRLDMIYPYAAEVINDLCASHEVHFVTHRNPERTGELTARWIAAHFRNYAGLHVLQNRVEKHEVMAWDVFIDDKPETIAAFEARGLRMLTPDRPWNEGCGAERFSSWLDVAEVLL